MTGARVVRCAQAWIGTPYRHQASLKGVGCDCLGLVLGVLKETANISAGSLPSYTPDWGEIAGHDVLIDRLQNLLARLDAADDRAGTLLVFRMRQRGVAKHLGIQTQGGPLSMFVHAYSGRGVVESRLTCTWRRKIAARFVIPER